MARSAWRWLGSVMLAVLVSAMYATGFSNTQPAMIVAAFVFCLAVMFAPVPLKLMARRNGWFWLYAIACTGILFLAVALVHVEWDGSAGDVFSARDVWSLQSIAVTVPVVLLIFAGIVGTSYLAPRDEQPV